MNISPEREPLSGSPLPPPSKDRAACKHSMAGGERGLGPTRVGFLVVPVFSPKGATVNSQGRQPLGTAHSRSISPEGAAEAESAQVFLSPRRGLGTPGPTA